MARKRESWSLVGWSTIEHSPTPTIPTLAILAPHPRKKPRVPRVNIIIHGRASYYTMKRISIRYMHEILSQDSRLGIKEIIGRVYIYIYKRWRVRVKSNQWESRWRCRRFTCVICKWQEGGRFHYETGGFLFMEERAIMRHGEEGVSYDAR